MVAMDASPDGYDVVIDGFDLPSQLRQFLPPPGVAAGADPLLAVIQLHL